MTLREVQQTINEFRDGGWAAIVRTRNHLLETLSVTGLAPYIGLCLAMTVNTQARGSTSNRTQSLAPPCSIWSVQIVSLFNRLSAESNTQDDMKDHGLTSARLMLTPIIAGLAAVGGVFLTSLLANGVAGAVSGTGSAAGVPDIGTIYNVSVKPFGLLLAPFLDCRRTC